MTVASTLEIPTLLPLRRYADDRGFLEALLETQMSSVVCVKRTLSKRAVIRGFHWQHAPSLQSKFIFVLQGTICDVAVRVTDRALDAANVSINTLSEDSRQCLFIPSNYAHAYQTISTNSIVLYVCQGAYDSKAELAFNPLKQGIDWPVSAPIVSQKDLEGQSGDAR